MEDNKPSLSRRLLQSLTPTRKRPISLPNKPIWKALQPTNIALHLPQDPQPETNATHRRLPEEHRKSWTATTQQQHHQALRQHSTTDAPRPLQGPIPHNPTPGSAASAAALASRRELDKFQLDLDLRFLAPLPRHILHQLRRVKRSSCFRPLLDPAAEILLVSGGPADVRVLAEVRDRTRGLPDAEKRALAAELRGLLSRAQAYVLGLLLFAPPGLRITDSTSGCGLAMPEGGPAERPLSTTTSAFFEVAQGLGREGQGRVRFELGEGALSLRGGGGSSLGLRRRSALRAKSGWLGEKKRISRGLEGFSVGARELPRTAGEIGARRWTAAEWKTPGARIVQADDDAVNEQTGPMVVRSKALSGKGAAGVCREVNREENPAAASRETAAPRREAHGANVSSQPESKAAAANETQNGIEIVDTGPAVQSNTQAQAKTPQDLRMPAHRLSIIIEDDSEPLSPPTKPLGRYYAAKPQLA